jgi:tetratricopeptide (TPR) repeat protein
MQLWTGLKISFNPFCPERLPKDQKKLVIPSLTVRLQSGFSLGCLSYEYEYTKRTFSFRKSVRYPLFGVKLVLSLSTTPSIIDKTWEQTRNRHEGKERSGCQDPSCSPKEKITNLARTSNLVRNRMNFSWDLESSTMLNRIIALNSNGIIQLDAGRHDHAGQSFKLALEQTTDFFLKYRHQLQENCPPSSYYPPIIRVPVRGSTRGFTKDSYIYPYALTVDITNPRGATALDYQYSLRLTVVLMFNLGLVNHWHALQQQQQEPSRLMKALGLYEMAWGLLQRSHYGADPSVLGILNNMGAIHHELAEYDQAKRCFATLKSMLMSGVMVEEQEVTDGILLNLLLLEEPQTAAAA